MSKNIKEIGKELLGKSLNSYHRRTGLTQLEENNKMQDGILNGILSQVDDAYIEKTEQSNVIHLDGSGDGVVVLDSIEGNTMVNILKYKNIQWVDGGWNDYVRKDQLIQDLKTNTEYTIVVDVSNWNYNQGITLCCDDTNVTTYFKGNSIPITGNGRYIAKRTTKADFSTLNIYNILYSVHNPDTINGTCNVDMMIFEGDWTDKEIPPYFEGLQSSFEEKVNDEGKYEIEILSNNGNIFDINAPIEPYSNSSCKVENESITVSCDGLGWYRSTMTLDGLKPNTTYYLKYEYESISGSPYKDVNIHNANGYREGSNANALPLTNGTFTTPNGCRSIKIRFYCGSDATFGTIKYKNIMISENDMNYTPRKHNKIKLLLNEPLRSVHNIKDRLCIKDNKLVIERNVFGRVFDGTEDLWLSKLTDSTINVSYRISATLTEGSLTLHMCDRLPNVGHNQWDKPNIGTHCKNTNIFFNIPLNWLSGNTINDVKQYLADQYNQGTPMKIVHILNEPIYEEVLNEYGEPILLEGYENGTLYIDSTIIPTTTVKYTPKMESFNTLKEVANNNIMLTNDVNDNIIPYMMDVDLMIMKKEMALMSHKNIRKMEVLDMTSMQKRTQDMLERLIKGKTLTEQECKTRVTTYLHAGKITDEQAEELMLLIDEVYA